MRLRHRAAVIACVSAALASTLQSPASAADAPLTIASGCTAERPTALTGAIFGYPDNRSLGALVAMDLIDATGAKITPDGAVPTGGYSYTDWVNGESLDGQGTADPHYERTWGRDRSAGQLCISALVRTAYFEVYPKSRLTDQFGNIIPNAQRHSIHVTDTSRYGLATLQNQTVIVGALNTWTLRLPLNGAARDGRGQLGNTGDIAGTITYLGQPFDPGVAHQFVRINTWASNSNSCGVHGFATNVDDADIAVTDLGVGFVQRYLAAGQCHARSQSYKVVVDCYVMCGAPQVELRRQVAVIQGTASAIAFAF